MPFADTTPAPMVFADSNTYVSTMWLFNSNGVTFGMSGSTAITGSIDVLRGIAAGTQTASTGTVVLSNSNNVSFGMSGSSQVTANATLSAPMRFAEAIPIYNLQPVVTVSLAALFPLGTAGYAVMSPLRVPSGTIAAKTVRFYAERNGNTNLIITIGCSIFRLTESNGSAIMSREASTTMNISINSSAGYSGIRAYDVTGMSDYTLTQGMYGIAINFTGATATAANLLLYGDKSPPPRVDGTVYAGADSVVQAPSGIDQAATLQPFMGVVNGIPVQATFGTNFILGSSNTRLGQVYVMVKEV